MEWTFCKVNMMILVSTIKMKLYMKMLMGLIIKEDLEIWYQNEMLNY